MSDITQEQHEKEMQELANAGVKEETEAFWRGFDKAKEDVAQQVADCVRWLDQEFSTLRQRAADWFMNAERSSGKEKSEWRTQATELIGEANGVKKMRDMVNRIKVHDERDLFKG